MIINSFSLCHSFIPKRALNTNTYIHWCVEPYKVNYSQNLTLACPCLLYTYKHDLTIHQKILCDVSISFPPFCRESLHHLRTFHINQIYTNYNSKILEKLPDYDSYLSSNPKANTLKYVFTKAHKERESMGSHLDSFAKIKFCTKFYIKC